MRELTFRNGRPVATTDDDAEAFYCLHCDAQREPEADAEPHADDCPYAED